MKNEFFNAEIDNIIRESVKLTDKPGTELNNKRNCTKKKQLCVNNQLHAIYHSGICR